MIETKRLRLRAHRVEDFDRYLRLWTQPEAPGAPSLPVLNEEEVWARLLRFVGHWSHFGYGLFIVEERASGELVGEAGLAHFHRNIDAYFDAVPEAGWKIRRDRRGQGLGSEVMRAAHEWFDHRIAAPRTVCMIDPQNAASIAVAVRLGYREFARNTYRDEPVILLERFASP